MRRPVGRHLPWGLAILLAAVAFLPPIGAFDLADARETHLGADGMDTLRGGGWLVVWDREAPRLKKPPLARWAVAASLAVGGNRVLFVRLPGVLCVLAAAVLVGAFARRIAPAGTGPVAVAVYATTGIVATEAWIASAEQMLALTTTAALYAAWRAQEDATTRARTAWLLGCGLLVGVGVLVKGPIALLFVLLPLLGFALTVDRRRAWRTVLHPALWLGVVVLVGPWLLALLHAYPQAPDVWGTEVAGHTAAAAGLRTPMAAKYFLLAAPWVPLAAAGLVLPWHPAARVREERRARLDRRGTWFAWWWVVGNILVFTLFVNPRSHYFVPVMPGVAVLCALAWAAGRWCEVKALLARFVRDASVYAQTVVLLGGYVALPVAAFVVGREAPHRTWLVAGAAVLGALGVVALVRSWRRPGRWSADVVRTAAPLAAAFTLFGLLVYPSWVGARSYRPFAERARAAAAASGRILYRVEDRTANTPLYARIRLSRELDFYLDPPAKPLAALEALPGRLVPGEPVLMLLTAEQLRKIQALPGVRARRIDMRRAEDAGRHGLLAEVVRTE